MGLYLDYMKNVLYKRNAMPVEIIHFVTARCNARCEHCFYYKSVEAPSKDELTLEEIEKIAKSIKKLLYLSLTGGEPFVREDLPKIAKVWYDYANVRNLSIPSNGYYVDRIRNYVREILITCPELDLTINLSLDDFEANHDINRKLKGCFNKVLKSIKVLKELKKEFPRLNYGIITTMTYFNEDHLDGFIDYVQTLDPESHQLNLIRGEPKKVYLKKTDIGKYKRLSNRLNKLSKYNGDNITSNINNYHKLKQVVRYRMNKVRTEIIAKTVETGEYQTPCYAGALMGVIYEDGRVFPCEILNKQIGNIRNFNYDFRKLWMSNIANETRKFIRDTNCHCTHECFYRTNVLYNPRQLLKVVMK